MRPIGRTLVRSTALATVLSVVMTATTLAVTWGPAVAVSASGHAFSTFEDAVVTGTQKVHVFYTEHGPVTGQWELRPAGMPAKYFSTRRFASPGSTRKTRCPASW